MHFLPERSSQSSTSLYLSGLCEPRRAGHVLWPMIVALLGFDSWWLSVLAPDHHGHAVPKSNGKTAPLFMTYKQKAVERGILSRL